MQDFASISDYRAGSIEDLVHRTFVTMHYLVFGRHAELMVAVDRLHATGEEQGEGSEQKGGEKFLFHEPLCKAKGRAASSRMKGRLANYSIFCGNRVKLLSMWARNSNIRLA